MKMIGKYDFLLTRERRCKIEKLSSEVGDLRQGRLDVFLEVLHGHGGEVKEFVSHFEGATQRWGLTDVTQDSLNLIQNL